MKTHSSLSAYSLLFRRESKKERKRSLLFPRSQMSALRFSTAIAGSSCSLSSNNNAALPRVLPAVAATDRRIRSPSSSRLAAPQQRVPSRVVMVRGLGDTIACTELFRRAIRCALREEKPERLMQELRRRLNQSTAAFLNPNHHHQPPGRRLLFYPIGTLRAHRRGPARWTLRPQSRAPALLSLRVRAHQGPRPRRDPLAAVPLADPAGGRGDPLFARGQRRP